MHMNAKGGGKQPCIKDTYMYHVARKGTKRVNCEGTPEGEGELQEEMALAEMRDSSGLPRGKDLS